MSMCYTNALQQRVSFCIIALIWRSLLDLTLAYLRVLCCRPTTLSAPGCRSLRSTEHDVLNCSLYFLLAQQLNRIVPSQLQLTHRSGYIPSGAAIVAQDPLRLFDAQLLKSGAPFRVATLKECYMYIQIRHEYARWSCGCGLDYQVRGQRFKP